MEWREILTAPGYYVSSCGKVKGPRKVLTPKKESQRPDGTLAYKRVSIRGREMSVHRLVAEAFIGVPAPGCTVVDHLDGNRHNNTHTNLRWVSQAKNIQAVFGAGRHSHQKLTPADVASIRRLHSELAPVHKIAKVFGVSKTTVYRIVNNQTWTFV